MQTRKDKLPELKRAREEGKVAYFSHTRLIIRDRREDQLPSRDDDVVPSTAARQDGNSGGGNAGRTTRSKTTK